MPLNPHPKIKNPVCKLLRTWPEKQAVADAIAKWNAADLEQAGEVEHDSTYSSANVGVPLHHHRPLRPRGAGEDPPTVARSRPHRSR
ncbi:hypothetical protein [Streptomyces sp. NPDC056227]|uniref:hypothetical protein n=1 Tax=Streptomyces sp. NPDC056227 TaxID=3345753 RepID=UPI0035DC4FA1